MEQRSAGPTPGLAAPDRVTLRDSLRYWEIGRVPYNLLLAAVTLGLVLRTWPHFRPAIAWDSLPKLLGLALIANALYCAAYFFEFLFSDARARTAWRARRWALWLAGTLFAMLLTAYWILDEIYPAFPSSASASGDDVSSRANAVVRPHGVSQGRTAFVGTRNGTGW